MSFAEEKREWIKKYMLEKIRQDDGAYAQKTMENFEVSITTVKRYLKECVEQKIIVPNADKECGYCLITVEEEWEVDNVEDLEEDTFYFDKVFPILNDLSENSRKIWYYAFTEMMNNAIEHAKAKRICCKVKKDVLYTEISIADDGIGIFNSIRQYADQQLHIKMDTAQARMELYKGKFTTSPESHSGEGIFFTSKMLAQFALWSEDVMYSNRCDDEAKFVRSHLIAYYTKLNRIGTMVQMKLENDTKRTAREVFDMFAPLGEGVVKTLIPMKEFCRQGEPVARSQARRILSRLEEFKEVIFDFSEIDFMGQGFADEIFRVFQNRHPDIVLTVNNANEEVAGMIQHVKSNGNH